MRKVIIAIPAAAALLLLACGDDEGPVGTREISYWDIAYETSDTVITDIDMRSDKLGWATGFRPNVSAGSQDGLIYNYDGTAWRVAYFLPGAAGAKLLAVDFDADTDGWVIGMRYGEMNEPVILHYKGNAWVDAPTTGLNGGALNLLAAFSPTDVRVSDGTQSFHFNGTEWTAYPITEQGTVDRWCFPAPEIGWAVDSANGYCYRWDNAKKTWTLEPYPIYNVSAFYFTADGAGIYTDYENAPPVGDRANFYLRVAGELPVYEKIFATNEGRLLSQCDYLAPDYFFFAGPNAAYEVNVDNVKPLNNVPAGDLGYLKALSIGVKGDVWGVMGPTYDFGPSFIVHKRARK
jgi:hypothetical protein